jgi:TonB-dependent SusC/RagA subfamily outer membrane receptor
MHDVINDMFATEAFIRNDGEIIIRGAVVMEGNEAALLIVDGREVDAFDFANINTQDIASINLLKDASTAVYGSRGGNGVIIVETKRGRGN